MFQCVDSTSLRHPFFLHTMSFDFLDNHRPWGDPLDMEEIRCLLLIFKKHINRYRHVYKTLEEIEE